MSGWQPDCDVGVARRRQALLARARRYFGARDVVAVDVPALGAATVTDPQIESLRVGTALYLQTSPEYFMKRLLAAGYPDIYSICRVFRDGESGRLHLPEFTMIEWYRRDMGLGGIVDDTIALIAAVLGRPDLGETVDRKEYAAAFTEAVGLDPLRAPIDAFASAADAGRRLREALADRRQAWLDLLFATRVAPSFRDDRLTVVRHYPASQAALARLCPDNRQVADRFEVFYGAVELGNGYVELTDAAEQRQRMITDNEQRLALGKVGIPADERLLAALHAGIGDCAGVAVGLERLHMLAERSDDIRKVVTFSDSSR